ncbi:nuclease-related domain-containing protein [Lacticaseibacillus kribbianus]|uniref:nuclease-related domain-containing protein n=1 Tax=Lacticaseibacillus kribbianus TaxID=2926292 RepID=UPI001CD78807|nr:nuclease-related domain-containing protein [Lacticaseibacillus kribbianus]
MPNDPRPYTNRGEYRTYRCLHKLQAAHPEDNIRIYSDLYLDNAPNRPNRQVDHLMISHRGIFMLETKYWRGTIYHEVSKRQLQTELGAFWPLIGNSISEKAKRLADDDVFTLVTTPENPVCVHAEFEDPTYQVRTAGWALRDLLRPENEVLPFVRNWVLYNYPHDADNRVIDLNHRLDGRGEELDGFTNLEKFTAFYEQMRPDLIVDARLEEIDTLVHTEILLD